MIYILIMKPLDISSMVKPNKYTGYKWTKNPKTAIVVLKKQTGFHQDFEISADFFKQNKQ